MDDCQKSSAIGYARIGLLSRPMFNQLTCVCAQSALQGERFERLGISSQGLHVTGSVKFDLQLPEDLAARRTSLREKFKGRSVLLAASTHKGEEDAVLAAFKEMGLQRRLYIGTRTAPSGPNRRGFRFM